MTTPETPPLTFSQRQEAALKRLVESPAALLHIEQFYEDIETDTPSGPYPEYCLFNFDEPPPPRGGYKEVLQRRKGCLITVTPWGFLYERIRHEEPSDESWVTLRIYERASPHVQVEGMVIIQRKAYWVTQEDLTRGRICASRQLQLVSRPITVEDFKNATAYRDAASAKRATSSQTPVQLGGHGNLGIEVEAQELDVADRLLSEQINALLGT